MHGSTPSTPPVQVADELELASIATIQMADKLDIQRNQPIQLNDAAADAYQPQPPRIVSPRNAANTPQRSTSTAPSSNNNTATSSSFADNGEMLTSDSHAQ
jgi:hypothetical protein